MIFRLSKKLSQKIKIKPDTSLPLDIHPLTDWSAHVFISNRAQYIILTNTASLFSIILPGAGITNAKQFASQALASMAEFLSTAGYGLIYQKCIEPFSQRTSFCKPLNHGVTGSMTDFVKNAKYMSDLHEGPPTRFIWWLNSIPMFYLKGDCFPDSRFRKLAEEAGCKVAESPFARRERML